MSAQKSKAPSAKGKPKSGVKKKPSSGAGNKAAPKSSSKPASKPAPKKMTAAEARRRAIERKKREELRKQLIKSLILFLSAVLITFIYLMPGEKMWLSLHELYHGLLGMFGFMLPALMIYAAYQYAKDEPDDDFKGRIFCISAVTISLSTAVYCFGVGDEQLRGYADELHESLIFASTNAGPGVIGAMLGIPFVKIIGQTGGGFISILLFLVFLALSFGKHIIRIMNAFKQPVKAIGRHFDDNREIRSQVRRQQIENSEKQKQKEREEYIKRQVDKKLEQKKKKELNPYRKYKRSPFYEADRSEFPKQKTAPPTKPEAPAKSIPKQSEAKPEPIQEPLHKTEPESNPSPDDSIPISEQDIPFDESEYDIDELQYIPDKIDLENEPFFEPKPIESRKSKKNKAKAEEFEINPENEYIDGKYVKPPFSLLEPQPMEEEKNIALELNQRGSMLVDTLNSFGVQTSIVNISRGPSVTRYELQPASGVKISKITNLADDIAMNLAAVGVRIEAPIPGKSAVGIEVPNKHVSVVKMRNLVESSEFRDAKSNLTVALGKDISGKMTFADLARMPHLLIAGSTGSGKSVCINSMLVSLLYKASPEDVKLILIDPKVVELGVYNGIPHLLVPVVTDPRKAAGALNWAVNEMLNRYKVFAEYNVRDMHNYNRLVEKLNTEAEASQNNNYVSDDDPDRTFEEDEMLAQAQAEIGDEKAEQQAPKLLKKMPQIVIIIDELADLMMAAPKDVEEAICRLAQMARAAGMHLVIATQRPSVDVITGLIKANVPSRIAFAVKSQIDSRTILDTSGAEKLLGRGDMLFSPIGRNKPLRIQGCFVDDPEIEKVIDFIKQSKAVEYDQNIVDEIENNALPDKNGGDSDDESGEFDPMIEEAIKCVVEAGQASTSMLQRRFRVGYARAGRLIDEMEQMGIVGPHEGSKPRQVLMTYQQWMERNMGKND